MKLGFSPAVMLGVAMTATVLMTGCECVGQQVAAFYSKEDKADAPTIVINGGYKAILTRDGVRVEPVLLSGFDRCPEQGRLLVLGAVGAARDEARNDCIVIDKTRSSVKVQAAYGAVHRVVVERWAIQFLGLAGDRIALIPPGGGTLLDLPSHI